MLLAERVFQPFVDGRRSVNDSDEYFAESVFLMGDRSLPVDVVAGLIVLRRQDFMVP